MVSFFSFPFFTSALVAGIGAHALPQSQGLVPRGNLFSRTTWTATAEMTVVNDWPKDIQISIKDNKHMSDKYPSTSIPAFANGPMKRIKEHWLPLASSFKIYFDSLNPTAMLHVGIGQLQDRTWVKYSQGIPGQTGGIVAPAEPFSKDTTWNFFFFTGPGIVPPLLNSLLQANLPALQTYFRANPAKPKISEDIELEINGLPNDIKCTYAALKPNGGPKQYAVNVIMEINGEITGNIKLKKLSRESFSVKLSGLTVLVQATLDMNNVASPGIKVTRLQFAVRKLDLSSSVSKAVGVIFPIIAKVLQTPYLIAGYINTKYNGKFIDFANNALGGMLPKLAKRDWTVILPREAFHVPVVTGEASLTDTAMSKLKTRAIGPNSFWMSTDKIQNKLMKDLKIPGTHDSATNALTAELSDIKYPDISFLWNFDYVSPAPNDGSFPSSKGIHLGPVMGSYVMNRIKHISQAQDQSIKDQLLGGIRWFDLRLYYDTVTKSFFSQHGLKGINAADIFSEVRSFLSENSDKKELVMLGVSHTNFGKYPECVPAFQRLVQEQLGQYIYMPPSSRGVQGFNFQSLSTTRLSDITNGNKVMVLNLDNKKEWFFTNSIVNTDGYADGPGTGGGMYQVSNVHTPTPDDIIPSLLDAVSGQKESEFLLQTLALRTNGELPQFLAEQTAKGSFNLVTTDWYSHAPHGVTPPVDLILSMN